MLGSVCLRLVAPLDSGLSGSESAVLHIFFFIPFTRSEIPTSGAHGDGPE